MNRRTIWLVVAMGMVSLVAAASLVAGTTVEDVIKMQNKAYSEHTKAIAEFTHKKHIEDHKVGCGECHHDAQGKALKDLKAGDPVQNCIECHKIPGQMPAELKKELREKKAPKEEIAAKELEYHAEAIHTNCVECHKEHNKKNNTKAAPATCTQCHPKDAKDK